MKKIIGLLLRILLLAVASPLIILGTLISIPILIALKAGKEDSFIVFKLINGGITLLLILLGLEWD